jgi:hypothetical protein
MIETVGPNKWKSANMTIDLEAPDLLVIRTIGVIDKQDMTDLMVVLDAQIRAWPHVFMMVDQSKQESMTAEARKVAPEMGPWIPYRGTVLFGGSFAVRALGQMLMKLINLMRSMDNPTVFVKDEKEARAWVEKRRHQITEAKG